MPNINFKGFMADNAQVNWNVVKNIYGHGDLISGNGGWRVHMSIPHVCQLGQGDTKVYQTILANSTQTNLQGLQGHEKMDDVETKYYVICSLWLSLGVATKEGIFRVSKWLGFWHYHYR